MQSKWLQVMFTHCSQGWISLIPGPLWMGMPGPRSLLGVGIPGTRSLLGVGMHGTRSLWWVYLVLGPLRGGRYA